MSEPINSGFPFSGMEDSEELDVSAIFGGGAPTDDVNPFDLPAARTETPAAPPEQPKPEAPAAPAEPVVAPVASAPQPEPAPKPQPVPQAKTQNPAPASEPANPIAAAIDKQEIQAAQTAAKSLFEKAPIFSYGSARDEITDGAMTFEELRKTELGEFVAPKDNVVEFSRIRAGFTPALPLIPASLLSQIIAFFRCYMNETAEFEALAHILWDKESEEYVVRIPPQEVSKARVNADLSRDGLDETRYLHYMDIHSHNSMAAKFSPVDDQDERATRLYTVLGRLDRFFPEITVRMSCGGTYCELDPALVFEGLGEVFPREWRDNVKTGETRAIKDAKARLREVLLC